MPHIEVCKSEIAPAGGKIRIEPGGTLPESDGFFVAPAIVQQVPEVIRRARVRGIAFDGALQ